MEYVYVAQAGQFTKIGCSNNPRVRLTTLKHKPARLVFVARCANPKNVEQAALLYLYAHNAGGEYLDCGTRIAVAAVAFAATELCGRYEVIVDTEPQRWGRIVDKSPDLEATAGAAFRKLSP